MECLVARMRPQPPAPAYVRKLPTPSSPPQPPETPRAPADSQAGSAAQPSPDPISASRPAARPAVVAPLAPERYRVQVTVSGETIEKLRRVQDLLRHSIPSGDPAAILDRALTMLLEHLERTKLATTDMPRIQPSRGCRVAPHSGSGAPRRLGPRRRPLRVSRGGRPLYRTRLPRIPPRHPLRRGR